MSILSLSTCDHFRFLSSPLLISYHGLPVRLAPTTFRLMALLAKRPGEVVARDEIYARRWPEFSNPGASVNPYDRQISNHKRKITMQIRRA